MSGLPGVTGLHVPSHVEAESEKKPDKCKLLLEMVEYNVVDQQDILKAVMIKIVQVNCFKAP